MWLRDTKRWRSFLLFQVSRNRVALFCDQIDRVGGSRIRCRSTSPRVITTCLRYLSVKPLHTGLHACMPGVLECENDHIFQFEEREREDWNNRSKILSHPRKPGPISECACSMGAVSAWLSDSRGRIWEAEEDDETRPYAVTSNRRGNELHGDFTCTA